MLVFKNNNNTLKIFFKNQRFNVYLMNQLFFVQPIIIFKNFLNCFFYWFFFVLKNLYSFGLFSFNKNILKKLNIKIPK